MYSAQVIVTPRLAAKWLAQSNSDNRRVRLKHVEELATKLTAGEWKLTHQGIAFSKTDRLLDGQHRLMAIVQAGLPAELVVWRGCDEDMFGVLDHGLNRTVEDELRLPPALTKPAGYFARRLFFDGEKYTYRYMTGKSDPRMIAKVLFVIRPHLETLLKVYAKNHPLRTAATLKAGVVARMVEASYQDDAEALAYIVNQWKAFSSGRFHDTSVSVSNLLRRLEGANTVGAQREDEYACCAWAAFNPRSRTMTRILLRDFMITRREVVAGVAYHLDNSRV